MHNPTFSLLLLFPSRNSAQSCVIRFQWCDVTKGAHNVAQLIQSFAKDGRDSHMLLSIIADRKLTINLVWMHVISEEKIKLKFKTVDVVQQELSCAGYFSVNSIHAICYDV